MGILMIGIIVFLIMYISWTYFIYRWDPIRIAGLIVRAYQRIPWKKATDSDIITVSSYKFRTDGDKELLDAWLDIKRKTVKDRVEITDKLQDAITLTVGCPDVGCIIV